MVMLFDVLGLLVWEVDMKAPIVALECVGDVSQPSVLPSSRRGSMSPVPATEEERQDAVLDTVLEAYEQSTDDAKEEDEESGTVKHITIPTRDRNAVKSSIRLDGSRDLFSPPPSRSPEGRRPWMRRLSDSSRYLRSVSPSPSPTRGERGREVQMRGPRQSFKRPRIVTETFTSPTSAQTPPTPMAPTETPASPPPHIRTFSQSPVPHRLLHLSSPVQTPIAKRRSREVFEVFFEDALRTSRSTSNASAGTSSVYSQSSGRAEARGEDEGCLFTMPSSRDDIFTTRPTSRKPDRHRLITPPTSNRPTALSRSTTPVHFALSAARHSPCSRPRRDGGPATPPATPMPTCPLSQASRYTSRFKAPTSSPPPPPPARQRKVSFAPSPKRGDLDGAASPLSTVVASSRSTSRANSTCTSASDARPLRGREQEGEEQRGQAKCEFGFEPRLHALQRLCEKKLGKGNGKEGGGWDEGRGGGGLGEQRGTVHGEEEDGCRRSASPRDGGDGGAAGLRGEMALLRNEVEALTKVVKELAVCVRDRS
jgi:hypothetical protein